MCIIAFAYKVHPQFPLILIANRDEFYERPTRQAQFWEEEGLPELFAGKDLRAGGTWMGIDKSAKWASLTNYRDFSRLKDEAPSRGELVLNYFRSDQSAMEYLQTLKGQSAEYNDFNILVADNDLIGHYSNFTDEISILEPGIHGLSNALMNTAWPKVEKLKAGLEEIIQNDATNHSALFNLLANSEQADSNQLPQTGLPLELEKAMSSIFIQTENYGSRSSSLLFIKDDGEVLFKERVFVPQTNMIQGETSCNFGGNRAAI